MTNLPVYWANACVSYDIQQNASKQVPYARAAELFAAAFAKWTTTTCVAADNGRVSIDVKDLGPVACNKVQYSSNQGNQHVILFYDDSTWPYQDDTVNTLGLTTITFDPDTGEIYDADMAINSGATKPLSLGDPVPADGYDFQSIIAHETGHFLGMAHSPDANATMFASYMPGSTSMRTLSPDDTAGICSIYLPDGRRAVGAAASPGTVMEAACNPTPRHGFQSLCAQALGCTLSSPPGQRGSGSAALAATALALVTRGRRRARPPRM